MKSYRKVKLVILILFLIEITSLFLTYKSFLNKEINKIKETHEVKNRTFSLFIENEEGNYSEYIESNLFPEGYKINLDKSKCVDTNGNEVKGILSGTGTNITVKSTTTSYCYLYFDIGTTDTEKLIENVSSDVLWESTLEDDGYRYVGTNPDNYICFGTTKQSECMSNPDKYMYRIIGIFEDETGTQHLKLIKKEALNTTYAWHSDNAAYANWDESELYKGINGSYFVSNTDYTYLQDSEWYNKIETWDYTAANTKTYESSGADYHSITVQNIYLHEMNRDSKTSDVGEWDTVSAKIGLMYVSDYLLSLGKEALNYTPSTNGATLKTGWIHLSNNDSGAPSSYEETMIFTGDNGDSEYYNWTVTSEGRLMASYVSDASSVRPVFYLTSDVTLSGGGTSESPYIIS